MDVKYDSVIDALLGMNTFQLASEDNFDKKRGKYLINYH